MIVRCVIALAAIIAIAQRAEAQPPSFGEQSHAFRFALKANGLQPMDSLDALMDQPANTLLILFGGFDPLDERLQGNGLSNFLAAGGAVLIASDHTTPDELARQTNIRITGERLQGSLNDSYRGQMIDCPLLHDASVGRHAIFQNLPDNPRIATNRPSTITWERSFTILLATIRTPGRSFDISNFRRYRDQSAVAAIRLYANEGRLLVLADHDVFSNDMMIQSDNENFQFALGVIRWLTNDGQRKHVLLIEDGVVQSDLDVPIRMPPLPGMLPFDALFPIINRRIADLQSENALNRLIAQSIPRREMFRGMTAVLTLAILCWGVYRFLNARQRGEPRPKVPNLKTNDASLSELRPQAVLAAGQFGEAARELAHQTFADLGAPASPGQPPPEIAVRGNWLLGRRWRRRVDLLWSLTGDPGRVTAGRLQRLLADLHALRDAVASGVVQLHIAR